MIGFFFLMLGPALFFAGMFVGRRVGKYALGAPIAIVTLGVSIGVAVALAKWVLAIDPHRDSGNVPLPPPWDSVLSVLAFWLMLAKFWASGGFIGLAQADFGVQRAWLPLRLFTYLVLVLAATVVSYWVADVTFD